MWVGLRWRTDLINVFEVFLPQLLLYPNPQDPLNGEAAALLMRAPDAYNKKVRGESPPPQRCMLMTRVPNSRCRVRAAVTARALF
jgi:hypothetical protein